MSSRCSSNAISFSLCDDEDDAVGLAYRCQSFTHARTNRRQRLELRKKRRLKMCRIFFGNSLAGDGTLPSTASRTFGRLARERERKRLRQNPRWVAEVSVMEGGNGLINRPNEAQAIVRPEEHTSELQSLMRISYAVLCLQ